MAIDSAAGLLFSIQANADDATENIQRFRNLMGKDLDDLAEEVEDWADEVFGKITSIQGAMVAASAAMAAGIVALGVTLKESIGEYTEYADEIYRAAQVTGMHAEDLSVLHSAAAKSNTDFATLSLALGRFASNVVLATQGSKQQQLAFSALGISQKDLVAGQKDMLPLLEKVMDGFHNNTSAVQKAAIARDLFSRGGTDLIEFLSKGSEYLKENREEAEKLGLVLSEKDVLAAREFKLAQSELKEELEGLSVTIGKVAMPWLEKFSAAAIAAVGATKTFAHGGMDALEAPLVFLKEYAEEMSSLHKQIAAAGNGGGDTPPMVPPDTGGKVKEVAEQFRGLASIVDGLQTKVASFGTEWDRFNNEMAHTHDEVDRATADLQKLQAAGKLAPGVFAKEMAALGQIPGLISKIVAETADKIDAADTQKWGEAVEKSLEAQDEITYNLQKAAADRLDVTKEIAAKMAESDEQSYAGQRARLEEEMKTWADNLLKKTQLTADDWNAIDKITMQGLAKIDQSEQQAFQQELRRLQEHLDQMVGEHTTEQQKITAQYQKDLEEYSLVEEQKALKTAQSEAQAAQITQMYATIRQQITQRYEQDLQQLLNSQGWQGVFGNKFAQDIRQNQQLAQQWAQSTNQSLLMVKVTMESLKEEGEQMFQNLAQGMASAITNAEIMHKSVAQAMEQVLESTIESIAGQAMVQAIYATALGFLDLAEQNYAGATAAFTSAAIFGSIAAAGMAAGAMMGGGSSAGASGSGGSSGGSSSGNGSHQGNGAVAGAGGNSPGAQPSGPNVYVTVQGHVIGPSGASQLCDIINQAVYNNGSTLYATHTPNGVPL